MFEYIFFAGEDNFAASYIMRSMFRFGGGFSPDFEFRLYKKTQNGF